MSHCHPNSNKEVTILLQNADMACRSGEVITQTCRPTLCLDLGMIASYLFPALGLRGSLAGLCWSREPSCFSRTRCFSLYVRTHQLGSGLWLAEIIIRKIYNVIKWRSMRLLRNLILLWNGSRTQQEPRHVYANEKSGVGVQNFTSLW